MCLLLSNNILAEKKKKYIGLILFYVSSWQIDVY